MFYKIFQEAHYQIVFNRRKQLNSKGEGSIEIRITLNRKAAYFSTKKHIKPSQWNEKQSKVNAKHNNNIRINNWLQYKLTELENLEFEFQKNKKQITFDDFRKFMKSSGVNNLSVHEWCIKVLKQDFSITEATKNKRMVIVNRLIRFTKDLSFSSLDYKFMREFDNFLHNEVNSRTGQPLRQVTIHSQFKELKYFLHLACKERKIDYVPEYHVKKEEKYKEVLNQEELDRIENLNISQDLTLEKVRDMFIFCSYTAVRFGDLERLSKDNIRHTNNGLELHFIMNKVKNALILPLWKIFEDKSEIIIKKYLKNNDPTIFEVPTNQAVNRNLKLLKTLAKIEKPLTFHISRHTCLTMVGQKTGDPYLVMHIAGHSDIKTSMKYTQGVANDKLFDKL